MPVVKWIEWNEPFFTDGAPYCNTVRRALPKDIVDYMKRAHPMQPGTDEELIDTFKIVNFAWEMDYYVPENINATDGNNSG